VGAWAGDDEDALNLAPAPTATARPTQVSLPTSTATATLLPSATPVVAVSVPTGKPTPSVMNSFPKLMAVDVHPNGQGIAVHLGANGPFSASWTTLSGPDRILIRLLGVGLDVHLERVKEVDLGPLKRLRIAVKSPTETWVVADVSGPPAYSVTRPALGRLDLVLKTQALAGGSPPATIAETVAPTSSPSAEPTATRTPTAIPTAESSTGKSEGSEEAGPAKVPKVDVMFFDRNVVYQGRQYDRFPCANFTYNASDRFPLKRQFDSTLVFYGGRGPFSGELRILDPHAAVFARSGAPFAFELDNALTEYSLDLPWEVEFKEKGEYTLCVLLNGKTILKRAFYVGQTTDSPPIP